MSDDIREVELRLRMCKAGEPYESVYPLSSMGLGMLRDQAILSEARLAEHPADSDDLLTPEWLSSVGGRWVEQMSREPEGLYFGYVLKKNQEPVIFVCMYSEKGMVPRAYLKTRGEVRGLAKIFEIELKQ